VQGGESWEELTENPRRGKKGFRGGSDYNESDYENALKKTGAEANLENPSYARGKQKRRASGKERGCSNHCSHAKRG